MGIGANNYEYFIVSLFLFLQEFTRMKWSENENKERKFFCYEDDERREEGKRLNKIYNMCIDIWMCVGCVIISLFLFLREFTRVKWSENENEWRER